LSAMDFSSWLTGAGGVSSFTWGTWECSSAALPPRSSCVVEGSLATTSPPSGEEELGLVWGDCCCWCSLVVCYSLPAGGLSLDSSARAAGEAATTITIAMPLSVTSSSSCSSSSNASPSFFKLLSVSTKNSVGFLEPALLLLLLLIGVDVG
jgi:hypothetical protein